MAELIFITGATGFIGSATALEALKANYRLRICLRKESQIQKLQSIFSAHINHIEFVVVTDLSDGGQLNGKLDGVNYVLHIASPLMHGTNKETYFRPAVNGTLAVLKEAAKVPTIKKVVVTSSIAAFIPITQNLPKGGVIKENNDWDFTVDPNADFAVPNDPSQTASHLYHASKLLANNETWKYWETTRPHFSLVTIHPGYVFGHSLIQTTAEEIEGSTNAALWGTIISGIPTVNLTYAHVRDVAEAHIRALDSDIPNGSKYLIVGNKASWKDVARVVREGYPDSGAKITEDVKDDNPWVTDTSKAEKELGMRWRSLNTMVHEVMDQQLGFKDNVDGLNRSVSV